MKEILDEVERWREGGEKVVVATVVATRRSAPRPVGTSLAISESGKMCGSVSGGCVESDVFENAKEVLAAGEPKLLTYGITDDMAWSVGLPCGGEIDVSWSASSEPPRTVLPSSQARGERGVLFTVVEGEGRRQAARARVRRDARRRRARGGLASSTSSCAAAATRCSRSTAARRCSRSGTDRRRACSSTGPSTQRRHCARGEAARLDGDRGDARATFLTPERIPSADQLIAGVARGGNRRGRSGPPDGDRGFDPRRQVRRAGVEVSARDGGFYIGALGSRRNQERRRERLLEAGVAEEQIDRIVGPCGLDIGADTQAETALSILAEILATRAGRGGGTLRDAKQRIHAETS